MAKIMIDEDKLMEFSQTLSDIYFSIKMEVSSINVDRKMVYDLMDDLANAWYGVYNPIDITLSRSMRAAYSQYIQSKKLGDIGKASEYLERYLFIKSQLENPL